LILTLLIVIRARFARALTLASSNIAPAGYWSHSINKK
jgi:hypothetical protein